MRRCTSLQGESCLLWKYSFVIVQALLTYGLCCNILEPRLVGTLDLLPIEQQAIVLEVSHGSTADCTLLSLLPHLRKLASEVPIILGIYRNKEGIG